MCEMKTTRRIENQEGTISDPFGLNIPVCFDLIETQDFIEGVPVRNFTYGNLRLEKERGATISSLVVYQARLLMLTGGGIQAAVRFFGPDAFAVLSEIKEIAH
jgi:hypothetical protein